MASPATIQAPSTNPDHLLSDPRTRARARKLLQRRQQTIRYKEHPWPFLREQVLTEDPHDKSCLIKEYPNEPYLEKFVDDWFRERKILVPKSRRMLISWTCIALHIWLLLFSEHEHIYFAARKEGRDESQGSLELVSRAKFILRNFRSYHVPPCDIRRGRIICPSTHSEIVAIGEGKNQFRQLTATALFFDEFAFWEKARETYMAAVPTVENSGRLTIVSTAAPGFFKEIVFDEWV